MPCASPLLCSGLIDALVEAIGSAPIRVVRVVVVNLTRSVDIPSVVRVATIRRTQPAVLRFTTYIPMLYRYSAYRLASLSRHARISARVLIIMSAQYLTRLVER